MQYDIKIGAMNGFIKSMILSVDKFYLIKQ